MFVISQWLLNEISYSSNQEAIYDDLPSLPSARVSTMNVAEEADGDSQKRIDTDHRWRGILRVENEAATVLQLARCALDCMDSGFIGIDACHTTSKFAIENQSGARAR